jgi:putative ABC transport system ATP-binding protein
MSETAQRAVLIEAHGLTREHRRKVESIYALRDVSLTIARGEHVVLFGPSGSGKTTLLNLLAGLDQPSAGTVTWLGRELTRLTERELSELRCREMGFVFQDFGILRSLSALDNVRLPLLFSRERDDRARAIAALERLGLGERIHHRANELSRGELQRVAIARALVHRPALLLADEPTASLDAASAAQVVALFEELRAERDLTVLVATHDPAWLDHADRALRLQKGRLMAEAAA